jgi:polysaccharide biosynthesis/export protein
VAGVAGCSPGSDLPPMADSPPTLYRLGAGDQVRIITTGETQLSGEFRVNDAGTIAVPFLGTVPVAGLTTAELATRIERSLVATKLFRNPSVVAEVIAYRPIFVYGEVTRPGQYPYQPGMTVLTAVTGAGGYTYRAVDKYAEVIRTEEGKVTEGRAAPLAAVRPGDVIRVFESIF